MRPRKRILLVTDWEFHALSFRLLLETWGYAVARPGEPVDAVLAIELPVSRFPLLLVLHHPAPLIARVRSGADRPQAVGFGAGFAPVDNTELRRDLRLATARKRGPKPAWERAA